MVQTEQLTIDNKPFIRTYSDEGRLVVRDGIAYTDAIDPAEFGRIYTEGDLIPSDATDEDYAAAGRILLGVTDNG